MKVLIGVGLGVLIALFVPFGIAMLIVVGLIVVAMIPQFKMYQVPALVTLLMIVLISVAKVYFLSQLNLGGL